MKKIPVIILTILVSVFGFYVFYSLRSPKTGSLDIKSPEIHLQRELFTTEEWSWINLQKEKNFYVGVAQDYIPVEYLDRDGVPKGLGIEIIKKIHEFTGLNFELYANSSIETWGEILQSTREKKVDILATVSFTENRTAYLDFSLPYIEMTQVLVGHEDEELVGSYNKLAGRTFAVPSGYWFLETILKDHPAQKMIGVKNTQEAMALVTDKQADYTVCELPVFTYYKEQGYNNNLKIVGLLEKNRISIAVRKDLAALIPIINKVISHLNYDELYESTLVIPADNTREFKLILIVFVLLILLFITIYYLTKTFQKLAKAKGEAEEANRDKTRLMANISHDLRTPITVSMGYLEAILDSGVRSAETEAVYIRRTYTKLKYLSELIDDFFFISRLEDKKVSFNKEDVNINYILRDVIELVELKAKSKNIELISNIDNTADIIKRIDKLKFRRAMENILLNGIKYSDENGKIEIGIVSLEDKKIKISIKDSGRGIHAEDLPHIFERYYKGRNSQKDSSGLGLYITKEVIEKHNGKIWVESRLNQGSTFFIIL
ncbi:MAG: ATP-binding protein [Peptococcaceae bacterium]